MVKFSNIIVVSVMNIIYLTENVLSPISKGSTKCIDDIYENFGYNRRNTFDFKERIGKHAMLQLLESSLPTDSAKDYFKYIKGKIYVDPSLKSPAAFCDELYQGLLLDHISVVDNTLNGIITTERNKCKDILFVYFERSDDPLVVAKKAYENLIEERFKNMDKKNYEKKYYSMLVNSTHIDQSLCTPYEYCRMLQLLSEGFENNDKINKRNNPEQGDRDQQSISKRSHK